MSLILLAIAGISVAASAAGFTIGRRAADKGNGKGPDLKSGSLVGSSASSSLAASSPPSASKLPPVPPLQKPIPKIAITPLMLGDVVSADRDERWLAGEVVVKDGQEPVGALFFAPEGARVEVVAAFALPRKDIFWLTPVDFECAGEPPMSIELGGVVLRRKLRVPVRLERSGQGTPDVGETGVWAEYAASSAARAIILRTSQGTFAYNGKGLEEGDYDRMGNA